MPLGPQYHVLVQLILCSLFVLVLIRSKCKLRTWESLLAVALHEAKMGASAFRSRKDLPTTGPSPGVTIPAVCVM